MRLAERIEAIERRYTLSTGRGSGRYPHRLVSTGLSDVDTALQGGLVCGGLHEWFGVASSTSLETNHECRRSWTPPLVPLVHLAWRFLETAFAPIRVVWIGDRCFPYPRTLVRRETARASPQGEESATAWHDQATDRRLLDGSLFVSPRSANDRLWAVDLSLRVPAVGLVIADGSRFDMAATRRLQLVARSHGTPVLVVRPPWERTVLSAAQTRWLVRWDASSPHGMRPRWSVELMRCKGGHVDQTHHVWVVEWNRVSCTLNLSAPLARQARAADSTAASERRSRRFPRSA